MARISLLFTSDEHGQLRPAPRIQSEIQKTRAENPEGTLLVSSGDIFQGSAETEVLGTKASSDLLRLAGYDLITLGNHDFDFGVPATRQWIKDAPCPVLTANVLESSGDTLQGTIPSQIRDLNGVKVGFVGLTTPDTQKTLSKDKLEGLTFADPASTLKDEIAELRESGAQVIGVVSHLGIEADREVAAKVDGVDFILGGHSHTITPIPEKVNGALIVHPGSFRQGIGKLELSVDPGTGEIKEVDFALVKAESEMESSGQVAEFIRQTEQEVDMSLGQTVGVLPTSYHHDPDVLGDPLERFLGKALLAGTGGEQLMINQKGIRASLPGGPVTKRDIFTTFPFDNGPVNVTLTASEVQNLYQESFRRYDQTSLTTEGSFRVASDPKSRQILLYDKENQQLPVEQEILVTTGGYLLEGALGYFQPGQYEVQESFGTYREVLADHIAKEYPENQKTA